MPPPVNVDKVTIVTSHKLLENEQLYVSELFPGCRFIYFGEILSDTENAECDRLAYEQNSPQSVGVYDLMLNAIKNEKIVQKILAAQTQDTVGILLSDDLGFIKDIWIEYGFQYVTGEYHFVPQGICPKPRELPFGDKVHVAAFDGMIYVFVGKMTRIKNYIDVPFVQSDEMRDLLNSLQFLPKNQCRYLVTIHESKLYPFPADERIAVRYVQDGYLPPNYSSAHDVKFHPKNVSFYAWDALGQAAFANHDEPSELLPFRKKIFMPTPNFPEKISTVLIADNCAGPWSAQINRSDDDLMVEAVALLAKIFPDIKFLYRCHPTCVHPGHAGTNFISRAREYFAYTGLPNIRVTLDVSYVDGEHFELSRDNTSLLNDIAQADLVIAEYSHSLIEAAMEGKIFASVNLTNRRNFYDCITDMGFPHCRNVVELESLIRNAPTEIFRNAYIKAVSNYNKMIGGDSL